MDIPSKKKIDRHCRCRVMTEAIFHLASFRLIRLALFCSDDVGLIENGVAICHQITRHNRGFDGSLLLLGRDVPRSCLAGLN